MNDARILLLAVVLLGCGTPEPSTGRLDLEDQSEGVVLFERAEEHGAVVSEEEVEDWEGWEVDAPQETTDE